MSKFHACDPRAEVDDLDEFLEEQSGDPEFATAFVDAGDRSAVVRALVGLRKAQGVSQGVVARMMGTTQSAVSEFEGGATDPRLSTLQRYSRALGTRLRVGLDDPSPQYVALTGAGGLGGSVEVGEWTSCRTVAINRWSAGNAVVTTVSEVWQPA